MQICAQQYLKQEPCLQEVKWDTRKHLNLFWERSMFYSDNLDSFTANF